MNNQDELKRHLVTALVVFVAAFVAVFAGERLLPARSTEPPVVFGGEVGAQSIQPGLTYRNLTVRDYFINNGTETLNGAVSATAGLTVTGGTLGLSGVSFSGPVHFGSATAVISGTTIAHTLGVTPTAVLLTASGVVTTSPVLISANTISFTVGFPTGANPPAITIGWLAGK